MGNAQEKTTDTSDSYLDELAPGTELLQGQYKIVKFLNSGGFGITYLASDSLDRKVVIKECFPSSFCNRSRSIVQARSRAHTAELRSVVQLFVQEARSLAKLSHPNIVGVHQVFEDNETAYMVLDFVEGRDLLDTLEDDNHGLTAPQIKGILKDVLGAVQFIHSQDILHRDISPDNILLDADLRPVLIDFGAAREEATKKSRVLSAMRVVKDGYSPQEFYIQGSEQTPSSDLYALGATFYHLISGETPPNSQARLAAIASGDNDPYLPLVGNVKGYDTKFLAAIDKALGILPKDRMQSARDWLDGMESGRMKSRVVTQQIPPSSAAAATQQSEKRGGAGKLLGTVAVIGILAVGGLYFSGQLESFGPGTTAATETDTSVGTEATVIAAAPAAVETADEPAAETEAPVATTPAVAAEVASEEPAILAETDVAPALPSPAQVFAPQQEAAVAPAADPVENGAVVEAEAAEAAPIAVEPVEPVVAATPVAPEPVVVAEPAAEAEPTIVAEAPVVVEEPVVIDAPQPEATQDIDTLALGASAQPAPEIIAQVVPTLEPRISAPTTVAAPAAQDGLAGVIIAGEDIAAPAPQPPAEPVAEVDTSVFTTNIQVSLPFLGEPDSNVISGAAIVAPLWVRPGEKVLTVNGTPIETISEISGVLLETASTDATGILPVTFGVTQLAGAIEAEYEWSVPVVHETALRDGTTFQTTFVDGAWQTVVTAVPSSDVELRVGDVVVAYVATSEAITDHVKLREVFQREAELGTNKFNFAVTRDGSMWVIALTYAQGT